jgi:hypothetical protein
MMLNDIADWTVVFMPYPQYVRPEMIQECHHHKHQLQAPTIMASRTSYLNKVVISLDYIQIGNVVGQENDKMSIANGNDGNKFTIPNCKVISVDKTDTKNLIVDIAYQEAGRYKIVELQNMVEFF